MKVAASVLVLSAALGVSAHPSQHAHARAHYRSSPQQRDFLIAKKPVEVIQTVTKVVPAPAPTAPAVEPPASYDPVPPAPAPPSTTADAHAAPTATSKPSTGGTCSEGEGIDAYASFCSNARRATTDQIAYKGNVGTGGRYGCNLMTVKSQIASQYDHVLHFMNDDSKDQVCNCWNKIGKDGGINGFWAGNEAITFNISPGCEQYVAVDANSQGGCACGAGEVPTTKIGLTASTWVEFDMANASNNDWSGADASCLTSADAGANIPGLKVCYKDQCSTINPGGTGDNAYLGGMEAEDGVGLNLPAGKVVLDVTVGYKP